VPGPRVINDTFVYAPIGRSRRTLDAFLWFRVLAAVVGVITDGRSRDRSAAAAPTMAVVRRTMRRRRLAERNVQRAHRPSLSRRLRSKSRFVFVAQIRRRLVVFRWQARAPGLYR